MTLLGLLVVAAMLFGERRTVTYVVNLVPTVAAVGRSQERPTPAPPAKPEVPAPRPAPAERPRPEPTPPEVPRELPRREAVRETPQLPPTERAREPVALPEPGLATRAPGRLRASDKELPPVRSSLATKAPALPTPAPEPREAAAPAPTPPPPPPLGSPAGTPQGAGAVTLNVADFPYAYYIRQLHQKIQDKWDGRALEGRQPSVIFEIGREGRLQRVVIEKSSGNPYYDQLALRAIADASPFPPLPPEFTKTVLTVGLQFAYDPTAR